MGIERARGPRTLIALVTLVAVCAVLAGAFGFEFARDRYRRLEYAQHLALGAAVRNGLVARGFRAVVEPSVSGTEAANLWFVGHIYPKNRFFGGEKPQFPDSERPLAFLERLAAHRPPQRILFGGDSVWKPTPDALDHLEALADHLPQARFILGNHDDYWGTLRTMPQRFDAIYRRRYGSEDIDGVRVIHVHTVSEDGRYGLDAEQRLFLNAALDGTSYRYALLTMHHALWAGAGTQTNTPYPDAENLADDWVANVAPLLVRGRVKAVLAGDGGWRSHGVVYDIEGIPHYLTGWSGFRSDIAPEWLSIRFDSSGPVTHWNVLWREVHYRKQG